MNENYLAMLPLTTAKLVRSAAAYVVRHNAPRDASPARTHIATEIGYYVGLLIPMLMPKCSDPDSLRAYEKAGKPNTNHLEQAVREALAECAAERLAASPAGPED